MLRCNINGLYLQSTFFIHYQELQVTLVLLIYTEWVSIFVGNCFCGRRLSAFVCSSAKALHDTFFIINTEYVCVSSINLSTRTPRFYLSVNICYRPSIVNFVICVAEINLIVSFYEPLIL